MMDIPALAFPIGRTDLKGFDDMPAMVSQNFPTVGGGVGMDLLMGVMSLAGRGFNFNACGPGNAEADGSAGAVIYGG